MGLELSIEDFTKSQIIAHRGFWYPEEGLDPLHPNSIEAISRASEYQFGIEIDLRDVGQEIVVEHDSFSKSSLRLNQIIDMKFESLVCLNIKADGLAPRLSGMDLWDLSFYFDLSMPEIVQFENNNLRVADRVSEFEKSTSPLRQYVWLDSFVSEWWTEGQILEDLLENNHIVIVVSPELHKRGHIGAWTFLKPFFHKYNRLYLCTDMPLSARKFLEIK